MVDESSGSVGRGKRPRAAVNKTEEKMSKTVTAHSHESQSSEDEEEEEKDLDAMGDFDPKGHPHKCRVCTKRFKNKAELVKHERQHTGEEPYKCAICGLQYVQVESLTNHMFVHTGNKYYACEFCPKKYATKDHLKTHMMNHTGNKPFSCDACPKKFATKEKMNVHLMTHSAEKPYPCDICGLKFDSANLLSTHLRKHDDDSSSYSCTQCKLKFVSCENLRTHMKLHATKKDFQCHLCDKTYPRSDTLKRHILLFHENKRLYKCDICGKSFKGHIKDHLRTHTEDNKEKPYGCLQFPTHIQLPLNYTFECIQVKDLTCANYAQLPHLKKHMLCVHNTDRPYYCEVCETFFKVKVTYQEHAAQLHPDRIPADLAGCFPGPVVISAQPEPEQSKTSLTLPSRGSAKASNSKKTENHSNGGNSSSLVMPIEKLRALLTLLLKTNSSTSRLKKLGFGTRLIDEVLRDSIIASGRSPCEPSNDKTEREVLTANIEILLEWTIPEDYMENFRAENKPVEAILEELASIG